jgi:hypothetical protein
MCQKVSCQELSRKRERETLGWEFRESAVGSRRGLVEDFTCAVVTALFEVTVGL